MISGHRRNLQSAEIVGFQNMSPIRQNLQPAEIIGSKTTGAMALSIIRSAISRNYWVSKRSIWFFNWSVYLLPAEIVWLQNCEKARKNAQDICNQQKLLISKAMTQSHIIIVISAISRNYGVPKCITCLSSISYNLQSAEITGFQSTSSVRNTRSLNLQPAEIIELQSDKSSTC